MANVSFYSVEQFVWVDETGCNAKDHTRKFGYALKGETPEYYRIHAHGRRVSSVAAMSVDGVVAYELTYNNVNGEFFLDFLRASLVPEMMTYNGSNPKSIIIMDNCSVHHVHSVLDCLNTVGIVVIFLPPYSPDLNPIEEMFSFIKYYLKQHDQIIQALGGNPTELIKSAYNSITHNHCKGWIRHAGYSI